MTESEFWTIVRRTRRNTRGDRKRQEANLRRELHKLTPDQIVEFDDWFGGFIRAAYHWDLWGAAFVICRGCSNDGFWDFRSWLVAQGERVYKAAVENPESLARAIGKKDAARHHLHFSRSAMFVWGEKLGKSELELDEFPGKTGSNLAETPEGERFGETEAELNARYPRLWKKFGW